MDYEAIADSLLHYINELRASEGLGDLELGIGMDFSHVTSASFSITGESGLDDEDQNQGLEVEHIEEKKLALEAYFLEQFKEKLAAKDGECESICKSSRVTHMATAISKIESTVTIEVSLYYRYLTLEQPGPLIGGNLVLSGHCTSAAHGPAVCIVEFLEKGNELEGSFQEISRIMPWEMIFSPPEDEKSGEDTSFSVPISVGPEQGDGSYRIRILVDEMAKIPYGGGEGEDAPSVRSEEHLIDAITYTAFAGKGEGEDMEAVLKEQEDEIANLMQETSLHSLELVKIMTGIKVSTDIEEAMKMLDEGMDICVVELTPENEQIIRYFHPETPIDEDSGHPICPGDNWKFFICCSSVTARPQELHMHDHEGIEDVCFVRVEKSLGGVPTMPLYEVLHEDLSPIDSDYAVYIAVRIGPNPCYKDVQLVYQQPSCEADQIRTLTKGSKFRAAPEDVSMSFGGEGSVVGLMLTPIEGNEAEVEEGLIEALGESVTIESSPDLQKAESETNSEGIS